MARRRRQVARFGPRRRASGTGLAGMAPIKGQPFTPLHVPRTKPLTSASLAPKPPQAPGTPPLFDDAEASAARAKLRFDNSGQLTSLAQQGAYANTDYAEALRRMNEQRPKDEQSTKESANRSGLFYSGQLGKQLDEVATSYTRREGDARQSYDRASAAREAARQAIIQGAPLEEAAISAANADRQIARDQAAADAGTLVPDEKVAAGAPGTRTPAAAKRRQKPKPKPKAKPKRRSGRKTQVARFGHKRKQSGPAARELVSGY